MTLLLPSCCCDDAAAAILLLRRCCCCRPAAVTTLLLSSLQLSSPSCRRCPVVFSGGDLLALGGVTKEWYRSGSCASGWGFRAANRVRRKPGASMWQSGGSDDDVALKEKKRKTYLVENSMGMDLGENETSASTAVGGLVGGYHKRPVSMNGRMGLVDGWQGGGDGDVAL
ncbi:hypothetical protein EDB83DRAFT_2312024 [Lactarius deliciosus]|nr:hypothetical protein EDB83DRAFT_2312024 [Lactarius deliciosus]